jgi:beta-lactamase superfamily II metal-dependent hydrolase
MFLTLEIRRARKGDCLLLHYGSKSEPKLMLIDAGPAQVFEPQLRPRLEEIRAERGVADEDPLDVDVVMVSHIDEDHILGLVELTNVLTEQEREHEPQYLKSLTLWHNSFDDLLKTTPPELVEAGFGPASVRSIIEDLSGDDENKLTAAKVLASIPQGQELRDNAEFLNDAGHGWDVNDISGGKLILADKNTKARTIDGGLKITVVGPMVPELVKLQKEHDDYLREKKKGNKKKAESMLAAYLDESAPNLSSIVMLVEAGAKSKEKKILLTGDARGDKIIEGLKLTGLLSAAKKQLKVDVLKVPHHGSARNVEPAFFEQVIADHYVFSGDGEHGNPDREAVEMLLDARPAATFTMYFTYPIDDIDVERKKDWEKEQNKERKRLAAAKKKKAKKMPKVRADWKHAVNALEPVIAKLEKKKHTVKVLTADATGHLIELLDEIGF